MRIANAPSIIANPIVRKDMGSSLANGNDVCVKPGPETDSVGVPHYAPEVARDIASGRAAVGAMRLDNRVPGQLDTQAMMIASICGTAFGAGVGIAVDQLRIAHPTSAVALDAAFALIGGATAMAVASRIFEVTATLKPGTEPGKPIEIEFGIKATALASRA